MSLQEDNEIFFKILETNDYSVCCIVPSSVKCTTPGLWYHACSLLPISKRLKFTLFFVSVFIFFANILSSILHLKHKDKKALSHAYNIIILSINMANFSELIYLLILFIPDIIMGDKFAMKEMQWTSGTICFLAFGLNLGFSFLSPSLHSLLSYARFSVVSNPMESKFKQSKIVIRLIFGLYLTSIFFSATAMTVNWIKDGETPTSVCSPFIDPFNSNLVIKINIFGVASLNLAFIMFIVLSYTKLIISLKKSQESLKEALSKKKSNKQTVVQIAVLVTSNIVCLLFTSAMHVFLMFMDKYPMSVIVWTTVMIAPIDSVICPVVFSLTAFRQK